MLSCPNPDFKSNGTIGLEDNPSLALAAGQLAPVLANVNPADEKQQWLSLRGSQVIFNGAGRVMGQSGPVIAQKTDGAPEQLWYTFRSAILCGSTAQALTTATVPGLELPCGSRAGAQATRNSSS
ncbi:hypothetical protein FN846DRAFT_915968 [Sphaerosporella brunnea]|uniref:Uncharacterized protein n=1 Tax=Sphaerosporella brunnea TaxID=1250544 RepID=A0A5J5F8V3_9PEZI|nr:hypothetical protein FN846DRAFT_915963 [Sphaerosporella brunnea]KAA8913719.1 hypothetical protein FN846DRAFT_915968 [Sphaerosporella brunnea]